MAVLIQATTPQAFGAVGDGVHDDGPAIMAAAQSAIVNKTSLYIPGVSIGYLVGNPINLTNINGHLLVYGDGMQGPMFNLGRAPVPGGSMILGGTGPGRAVFDCMGSNNITFRDLNVVSQGTNNPSTIGFLFGTSANSPAIGAPGGGNCNLENVAIYLPDLASTFPVYYLGGAGTSHFWNVATVGRFGIVITASNLYGVASTFVSPGPSTGGVDGVSGVGCCLLGFGSHGVGGVYPLVIEGSASHEWNQTYICLLNNGTQAGADAAIMVKDVTDIRIKVECDYFPTVMIANGTTDRLDIAGLSYPGPSPVPANVPTIVSFQGTRTKNSKFDVVLVSGALPNGNAFYASNLIPTNVEFSSSTFLYNAGSSPTVAYLGTSSASSVPYWNLQFHGDKGAASVTALVNGSPAPDSAIRYWISGVRIGTA